MSQFRVETPLLSDQHTCVVLWCLDFSVHSVQVDHRDSCFVSGTAKPVMFWSEILLFGCTSHFRVIAQNHKLCCNFGTYSGHILAPKSPGKTNHGINFPRTYVHFAHSKGVFFTRKSNTWKVLKELENVTPRQEQRQTAAFAYTLKKQRPKQKTVAQLKMNHKFLHNFRVLILQAKRSSKVKTYLSKIVCLPFTCFVDAQNAQRCFENSAAVSFNVLFEWIFSVCSTQISLIRITWNISKTFSNPHSITWKSYTEHKQDVHFRWKQQGQEQQQVQRQQGSWRSASTPGKDKTTLFFETNTNSKIADIFCAEYHQNCCEQWCSRTTFFFLCLLTWSLAMTPPGIFPNVWCWAPCSVVKELRNLCFWSQGGQVVKSSATTWKRKWSWN